MLHESFFFFIYREFKEKSIKFSFEDDKEEGHTEKGKQNEEKDVEEKTGVKLFSNSTEFVSPDLDKDDSAALSARRKPDLLAHRKEKRTKKNT